MTKLDEVRLLDDLGTNLDCKVPFFCTAKAKFRLDSKPDRPYGSPYNSRGYFFSSTYFKYKKKSAEPEFDIYHTAASTSQFAAMIHAAHRTWGPIGFYIVAKAAQVLRMDSIRAVENGDNGVASVFVYEPKNSGKTQLQKFYLSLIGASAQLIEGSSSMSALVSAMSAAKGVMTCIEDPRNSDKCGNLVDPTLIHLAYSAGTQTYVKYGNRRCYSPLFVSTNAFPLSLTVEGNSADATLSRCMIWKSEIKTPPKKAAKKIRNTYKKPGQFLPQLWQVGATFKLDAWASQLNLVEQVSADLDTIPERMCNDCAIEAWFMTRLIELLQTHDSEEDDFNLLDLEEFIQLRLTLAATFFSADTGSEPEALQHMMENLESSLLALVRLDVIKLGEHIQIINRKYNDHAVAVRFDLVLRVCSSNVDLPQINQQELKVVVSCSNKVSKGVNVRSWNDGNQHKATVFEKSLFTKNFKTLFDGPDQKLGFDCADVLSNDSGSSGDELVQSRPRTTHAGIRRPLSPCGEEGDKKSKHGEEAEAEAEAQADKMSKHGEEAEAEAEAQAEAEAEEEAEAVV